VDTWFWLGPRKANLFPSSIDADLGSDLLSADPAGLSKGLVEIDLNDPVSSDGGKGNASLLALGGAGGLLGGEEASGSRDMLPVKKSVPGRLC